MKKLLPLLCLLCSFPAFARVDLAALLDASRSRNLPQLARLSEAAQGDVLEMYPRYHWLQAQISSISEGDAADFLARYPDSVLAERFRSDWLKELARRQNWTAFLTEYSRLDGPSTELQCLQGQAFLATGEELPATLKVLWFNGKDQPSACNPVFNVLFTTGKLDSEDAWRRIRLALAEDNLDLLPTLASNAGVANSFVYKNLLSLRSQPEKSWPQADTRAGRELSLYILGRVARTTPERAVQLLGGVEARWPESERNFAWNLIALQAAKKHNPQANIWYSHVKEGVDAESRAWGIRAALWANDWKAVLDRTEALPEKEKQDTAWRYWRARALTETGHSPESRQVYLTLAGGSDFYSLLAREELGAMLEVPNVQFRASEDQVRATEQLPAVRRAQALFQQNWRTEGVREWNWAMRTLSDAQLLAAAEYARRQGWPDRAIYSADRSRQLHDLSLSYLTPYRDVVEKQARSEGLDPAWVYGLMRQESRFVPDAKSGVGASGLMQLMPATAKWVANKLGWKKFNHSDVQDVATNVALGSRYLSEITKGLANSQVLATAGYNAGPGRARAWQADNPVDAAIYVENITFSETRDYVKKVMGNAVHYSHYFGSQTSLKKRMGVIPARNGNAPDLP